VLVGVGDDAAVLEPERGCVDVVTTDSLVEDVHFRRAWTPLDAIGHKALATCLSDLAAMGARPRAALLSLALPSGWTAAELDALLDGFLACGAAARTPLVGGNIAQSPGPLVVDTTAIGSVRRRQVLTRAGAGAGCALYVTGRLGGAAAGLSVLRARLDRSALAADEADAVARYERPEARLRCGVAVGRARAAMACIDLSDGLADGVRQIALASGLGAVVEATALPLHPAVSDAARRAGRDPLDLALSGGEDYELLFAVAPRQQSRFRNAMKRCRGLHATRIGELLADPALRLRLPDGREVALPEGYEH
jgi:thiamine-monophosphate kinase